MDNRISLYDSPVKVATAMSEGNPGALQVVMNLMKAPEDLLFLLALDSIGLYGSKLYMLWNDCCGRDMDKVKTVLRAWQSGKLSIEEIHQHVSGGYGTPFEGLDDEN